jgi:hypothetical protein
MIRQLTPASTACAALVLLSSFGINRGSLMPQATHPIFPQWREGQRWRVEYLRNVPSTEMKPVTQLPPPERAVWQYEVTRLDSRHSTPVLLSVTEEGGEGKFEMCFAPNGLTLLSVAEVSGDRKMDIISSATQDSFLSIPTGYPVIFDWPRFPQKHGNGSRAFLADRHRVREEVEFEGETQLRISMAWREERTAGLAQTVHSTQSWVAGQPWWSSASAESEMINGKEKSLYWSISGKLLL